MDGESQAPDWAALDVDLRLGVKTVEIDRADKNVRCADGASFAYDTLVLAMGGAPKRLPFPGLSKVHYIRTIDDTDALRASCAAPRRMIVVGAGVIGLEVAATARTLGHDVVVLEAAPRILSRNTPADLAEDIAALHKNHGADIRCGARIVEAADTEEGVRFTLENGERFDGDIAVAGIGIAPCVALAEAAGIACNNGVAVDDRQQTNDPFVFAVGDLAARGENAVRLETWANAAETAEIAAAAIAHTQAPKRRAPWFWTDQYDVNIQVVGDPLAGAQTVTRATADGSFARLYYQGDALVGAATFNNAKDMGVLRRMLDSGLSPAPDAAADDGVSMRALFKACKS